MKLFVKAFVILVSLFLASQSWAYTSDYVSAFKPVKQNRSGVLELTRSIQRDIFRVRTLIQPREKKFIGLMESQQTAENKKTRAPAEI